MGNKTIPLRNSVRQTSIQMRYGQFRSGIVYNIKSLSEDGGEVLSKKDLGAPYGTVVHLFFLYIDES